VPLDEIRANDYNMNITRYIDITEKEEPIDVQKVLNQLKGLRKERMVVENKMNRYLSELGFQV
jgi:type I restriction enzyme M protein